ncbi:unnamed protein product, partial [Prorocentrum cordatum]
SRPGSGHTWAPTAASRACPAPPGGRPPPVPLRGPRAGDGGAPAGPEPDAGRLRGRRRALRGVGPDRPAEARVSEGDPEGAAGSPRGRPRPAPSALGGACGARQRCARGRREAARARAAGRCGAGRGGDAREGAGDPGAAAVGAARHRGARVVSGAARARGAGAAVAAAARQPGPQRAPRGLRRSGADALGPGHAWRARGGGERRG